MPIIFSIIAGEVFSAQTDRFRYERSGASMAVYMVAIPVVVARYDLPEATERAFLDAVAAHRVKVALMLAEVA
jgi:hypothetical protein